MKKTREDNVLGDQYDHESFGQLQISRVSSSHGVPLYGSFIKHTEFIEMRLHRSKRYRRHHAEHEMEVSGPAIAVLQMSMHQFAELITTLNHGSGTTVTLRYIDGKKMESPPYISQAELSHTEFKKDMKQVGDDTTEALQFADLLCSGEERANKTNLKKLRNMIYYLRQHITSNMPFVARQFQRTMAQAQSQAKAEIDAFWTNTVTRLGIEAVDSKQVVSLEQPASVRTKYGTDQNQETKE